MLLITYVIYHIVFIIRNYFDGVTIIFLAVSFIRVNSTRPVFTR